MSVQPDILKYSLPVFASLFGTSKVSVETIAMDLAGRDMPEYPILSSIPENIMPVPGPIVIPNNNYTY